jgi:anti-anti-sigma factor
MGGSAGTDAADEIAAKSDDDDARVAIVKVDGALRAPVESRLMRRVQTVLRGGARRVLLDLSDLTGLDAAGVGELVNVLNATTAAGGKLNVMNVRPRVRRMMEAAGIFQPLEHPAEKACE